MKVKKTSGEVEPFDKDKFCASLVSAGAEEDYAKQVCDSVAKGLKPGATTTKIFRDTLRSLVKKDIEVAATYSLRRGLSTLGPDGFLFEHYVEVLLRAEGYETTRNELIKGECLSHEIDVMAKKDDKISLIEAKYHNKHGVKTRVDKVMYADARLSDIERFERNRGHLGHGLSMWVFTNTKFTSNAKKYAECRGERLRLTGWSYPKKDSLENLIRRNKLYPVTVLPSISQGLRKIFVEKNMLLAQDLLPYSQKDLEKKFGVAPSQAKKLREEVVALTD